MKNNKYIYLIKQKLNGNTFSAKLLKNTFISFLGEGGATILAFFTTIILIGNIGNENYGLLTVAYSFVLIVDSFVNFQAWHAMISFGSKALHSKEYNSLERLIKIGSIIDLTTAILGTFVAIFISKYVGNLMGWNSQIIEMINILSFTICFNFTGTSIGIIRLFDKFKYFSIYRVVTELLRLVLVIILCGFLKKGVFGAAYAFLLSYVIGYIILFVMFISIVKHDHRISIKGIIKSKVSEDWNKIFSFTFWTSMTSSADIPVQQFDVMFLSMLSYDIVAVFKVYKQIGQLLTKFATPLKQAVMPLFSDLISQKKFIECYTNFKKMKKKSNQIMIPLVILITLASLGFMYITLDRVFVEYWYILLFYLILRGLALSYAPIHPLFIALGQVKQNFIISLIANFSYIVVVLLSIKIFGIWSILFGLLVEYLIVIVLKSYVIKAVVYSKQ